MWISGLQSRSAAKSDNEIQKIVNSYSDLKMTQKMNYYEAAIFVFHHFFVQFDFSK